MLEVMNAGSAELPRAGCDRGVLLKCWDKSSPLIKELEKTVNFAERKCGDLMQQLHFYKEYYEKWAQLGRVGHQNPKKKIKKCSGRNSGNESSSENEFEKANEYLYKKIKSKINEMNNEITYANRKIQLRSEKFATKDKPAPGLRQIEDTEEAHEVPSLTFQNKACKSEPSMTPCDMSNGESEGITVTGKQSSKSMPVRDKVEKNFKKEWGRWGSTSKRRYASLQKYKIRSKSLPQGVRRKFGFGGFVEVFEPETTFRNGVKQGNKSRTSLRAESSKSYKSRKAKARSSEARRLTPKSSRNRIAKSKSDVRRKVKGETDAKKRELGRAMPIKEANACKVVAPSGGALEAPEEHLSLNNSLGNLMANPNVLLPFLRHPIPFVPCSSTSKSFNLGLNVQQVLSLIKRKKRSAALQAIIRSDMRAARSATEDTLNTLFVGQTTAGRSGAASSVCPARDGSEDGFSIVTDHGSKCGLLKEVQAIRSRPLGSREEPALEVCKPERPEDVWVVEQRDPTSREVTNSRSRCTCFPSKHCADYNKVLRQYTCWRPSPDAASLRPPHSVTKLCNATFRENSDSGGADSEGRTDLTKVHSDLLNLTSRKYSSLQEQISQNSFDDQEAHAELDAMESELAEREVEFKDILNFYNQLVVLKEKLKSLRMRVGQGRAEARQPGHQRPKKDPLRPTPSMALARVLKRIQGLQDKINLIDVP